MNLYKTTFNITGPSWHRTVDRGPDHWILDTFVIGLQQVNEQVIVLALCCQQSQAVLGEQIGVYAQSLFVRHSQGGDRSLPTLVLKIQEFMQWLVARIGNAKRREMYRVYSPL